MSTVVVENMNDRVTTERFTQLFKTVGDVANVHKTAPRTWEVRYVDASDAVQALKLHGVKIAGECLVVTLQGASQTTPPPPPPSLPQGLQLSGFPTKVRPPTTHHISQKSNAGVTPELMAMATKDPRKAKAMMALVQTNVNTSEGDRHLLQFVTEFLTSRAEQAAALKHKEEHDSLQSELLAQQRKNNAIQRRISALKRKTEEEEYEKTEAEARRVAKKQRTAESKHVVNEPARWEWKH